MVSKLSHAPSTRGPGHGRTEGARVTDEAEITGSKPAESRVRLWSDDPADIDLLSFSAISSTIVDALLDDELDPLAVGLSGSWGSGKTTVLRLIQQELRAAATSKKSILIV